jgi:hypothetical protein
MRSSTSLLAIGRYALAWTAAVALVALGAVSLLRAADGPRAAVAEPLELTAERGGCVLRRDAAGAAARNLDVMQPPTFGPPATPAAAGIYTRAPQTGAVVASLRRGMIVVQYRRGTPQGTVLALRRERVPHASIVAPGATGMRYALAATAWGRLLGCPRITPGARAAVRAFAETYQGRGPDAGR